MHKSRNIVLILVLASIWTVSCDTIQLEEQLATRSTSVPGTARVGGGSQTTPTTVVPGDARRDMVTTPQGLEHIAEQPDPTSIATPTVLPTVTLTPLSAEKYQEPGDYIDTIVVNDFARWFTIHIPPGYEPGVSMPLVLNLHAYTSTAFAHEELSQMNAKADKEGFIVVNPQALNDPPSWWGPLPGKAGQPDRDFFKELLAYLQNQMSIDPARIYATGMSNGGTMTYRLGCDLAGTLAAIAPVSGGHVAHHLCEIERPISVLVIHGTEDRVIPYYGSGTDSAPIHVWLEAWAQHNDCDPTPSVDHPYQNVTQETWGNCAEGTSVMLYSLDGGGHTWPGAPLGLTPGTSFSDMNATDVIWDFFKSHPKAPLEKGYAAKTGSFSTLQGQGLNSASGPTLSESPGGGTGQIAFSSHREGLSQIYVMAVPDGTDADGTGLTQLTHNPDRVGHPVWSPDGTRIAFVLTESGGNDLEIMVMEADGSGQIQLTDHPAVDSDPAWSPDGTRIAFTTNRDSPLSYNGSRQSRITRFEIYVMDVPGGTEADGARLVRLTDSRGWNTSPTWSPDGQWIAFQSNRDGNHEIYVMAAPDGTSAGGSRLRNLTRHPADDASPAWSPDGTRIAFHSDRDGDGNFEIYVMTAPHGTDAGGSVQNRLTNNPGWDIGPAWSPDGQYITFYREVNHNFEIYVTAVPDGMDVGTAGLIRLTHDLAFDGFASWQP